MSAASEVREHWGQNPLMATISGAVDGTPADLLRDVAEWVESHPGDAYIASLAMDNMLVPEGLVWFAQVVLAR